MQAYFEKVNRKNMNKTSVIIIKFVTFRSNFATKFSFSNNRIALDII